MIHAPKLLLWAAAEAFKAAAIVGTIRKYAPCGVTCSDGHSPRCHTVLVLRWQDLQPRPHMPAS